MRITTNLGISIPVIVRHKELQAGAAIDSATVRVTQGAIHGQVIGLTLARSGNRSIYGDLVVYRGKERVAEASGLAVYTPNRYRTLSISVGEERRIKTGDNLRIAFTERGGTIPMAETTVTVP